MACRDLSFNNLSGDLPSSFSSLSNLSILYLQSNQLTGPVTVLAGLPLDDLFGGNSFNNGPAPPPPPFTPPPRNRSHNNHNHKNTPSIAPQGSNGDTSSRLAGHDNNGLAAGAIVGIAVGSFVGALFVILAFAVCFRKYSKVKDERKNNTEGSMGALSMDPGNYCLL
ncbi:hypothetical protein ACLOJK_004177 [Asimina triloba]